MFFVMANFNLSFRHFIICTVTAFTFIITGCVTKPVKSPTLDQNKIRQLQQKTLPSRLPVPVHNVTRKELRDTWGAARGQGRSHEGIDIMAAKGTKVYSATDGIIASLKGNNLGGTVIWIIGPSGSWHYYAHLSKHKRGISEGDVVKKGDLIGYVGNTGNARNTPPHLHYGIYLNGKGRGAVNPYPYLK